MKSTTRTKGSIYNLLVATSNGHLRDSAPLPIDVFRAKDKLVIVAPIAGIQIEDISVTMNEDVLTISGKRVFSESISQQDYFSQECSWGEFSRSVVLPISVDINAVSAFYKNGILRVEMPVMEDHRSRVIPIHLET